MPKIDAKCRWEVRTDTYGLCYKSYTKKSALNYARIHARKWDMALAMVDKKPKSKRPFLWKVSPDGTVTELAYNKKIVV